jgi:hypothetical protein
MDGITARQQIASDAGLATLCSHLALWNPEEIWNTRRTSRSSRENVQGLQGTCTSRKGKAKH